MAQITAGQGLKFPGISALDNVDYGGVIHHAILNPTIQFDIHYPARESDTRMEKAKELIAAIVSELNEISEHFQVSVKF